MGISSEISGYNATLPPEHQPIAAILTAAIDAGLPTATSKVWHRSAVWFLTDNPIVGYASRKKGLQLLFWSGQSFDEPALSNEGTFKAAEIHYCDVSEVDASALARWLEKASRIQWDYKNIIKRKGRLEKLGDW